MKILYFYPENPLVQNQGNNARALALLNYFKEKKIQVDLVGSGSDKFTASEIQELRNEKLIKNGFLMPAFKASKQPITYFFKYKLPNIILQKPKRFYNVKPGVQAKFNEVLKANTYDVILISYACWASLVIDNPYTKKAKLVIDTHDFLTSQYQNIKHFKLGRFFETEINLLSHFNEILVISLEEKYIFSQFCKNSKVSIITHILPTNYEFAGLNSKYDIIYVASANNHNVKAAKWFFNEVYPLLSKNISILVIGKITEHIPDFDNVEKITFVEKLDSFYKQSKIAICPMLSGTGLKIKVVEALSFGLPIVCNEAGVDGLFNKNNNGCLVTNNADKFAKNIENLLLDTNFYEKIQQEAKSYFHENHSIENQYKKLDQIFLQ